MTDKRKGAQEQNIIVTSAHISNKDAMKEYFHCKESCDVGGLELAEKLTCHLILH